MKAMNHRALLILLATVWFSPDSAHAAPTASPAPPSTPGDNVLIVPPATPEPSNPPIPAPAQVPPSTNSPAPAASTNAYPRPVRDVFEAQVALARQAISPGSIDGLSGPQTRSAIRAFQKKSNLPPSGELDTATTNLLVLATPPCATYSVASNDLARLQPLSPTWLGKSQQTALDYETILELVAEKAEAHPNLIRRLNPGFDWANVAAGAPVQLTDVVCPEPSAKAAFVTVRLADKTLEAFDANTNLLAHFPCSIGRRVESRPVGELHVQVIAPNPNYTFSPEVFPESAEATQLNRKLILPPGPNNPVGVVWIGLDKPGYGIHGTPNPEQVGRTESHGCFRLANWNAAFLLKLAWIGMPVYVEP
jgi:lipoprotein-anchoring transpeptidase ErfK/SrfK